MKSKFKLALILLAATAGVARGGDIQITVEDMEGKPLLDAVVYLDRVGGSAKAPPPQPRAIIDQVNREFVPLVSVVQTGTRVDFPNSDNIRHSIYSFSPAKVFTTKLYSGKQAPPVVFDQPGLVVLGCNIHDLMVGWVMVVDTPVFGKTDAAGKLELRNVEPTDYRINIWYPEIHPGVVTSALNVGSDSISREFKVDVSGSALPGLRARAQDKKRSAP